MAKTFNYLTLPPIKQVLIRQKNTLNLSYETHKKNIERREGGEKILIRFCSCCILFCSILFLNAGNFGLFYYNAVALPLGYYPQCR